MGDQPLQRKRLLTVRQIIAALSILACLAFIFIYSSRVVLDSKVQAQMERYMQAIDVESAKSDQFEELIHSADDAAFVEQFARDQKNLGKPEDNAVALFREPVVVQPEVVDEPEPVIEEFEQKQNWELWWEWLSKSGEGQQPG